MSSVSRGNSFENDIGDQLEDAGWLVASRRHRGGAGDLLAIHPDGRRWLVECKTTSRGPWADYGPKKRQEHCKLAERYDASAWLVWRAPRRNTQWLPVEA